MKKFIALAIISGFILAQNFDITVSLHSVSRFTAMVTGAAIATTCIAIILKIRKIYIEYNLDRLARVQAIAHSEVERVCSGQYQFKTVAIKSHHPKKGSRRMDPFLVSEERMREAAATREAKYKGWAERNDLVIRRDECALAS